MSTLGRRSFLYSILPSLSMARRTQAATAGLSPYLQSVRPDRASILWLSRQPGAGQLRLFAEQEPARELDSNVRLLAPDETGLPEPLYLHKALLTNLEPATDYFYEVRLDGRDAYPGEEFRFHTPRPGRFSFLAFGDSGSGRREQFELAERINRETCDLVLHTGDVAYPDGNYEYFLTRHFNVYQGLAQRVAFFPTPGNVDYETAQARPYLTLHDLPTEGVPEIDHGRYYSFDWGNAHFVSMDSNTPLFNANRGTHKILEWLDRDLASTKKFWKIVYLHHSPYTPGSKFNNTLTTLARRLVVPILERYHVQLVLGGDQHNYLRTHPIHEGERVRENEGPVYITTGGGGAVLEGLTPDERTAVTVTQYHYVKVDVDGGRLALHTINIRGDEIDFFDLRPAPVLAEPAAVSVLPDRESLMPGSEVHIRGRNLAIGESAQVWLNETPLQVMTATAAEITARLPARVNGWGSLRVETPNGSAQAMIFVG